MAKGKRQAGKAETEADRKAIGARICELRRNHDPQWTQFDLAMHSGVRPETLSRIERATTDFQISHLLRIAAALEMEPADILKSARKARSS